MITIVGGANLVAFEISDGRMEAPGRRSALAHQLTGEGSAGETALLVLELLLLRLIDQKIVDPVSLIAEIESLAEEAPDAEDGRSALTVKARLSLLACSLAAARPGQ